MEKTPKDTIWPPHLAIYMNPQVGIQKIWNYGNLIHDKQVNNLDKGKQTTMNVLETIVYETPISYLYLQCHGEHMIETNAKWDLTLITYKHQKVWKLSGFVVKKSTP